MIMWYFFDASHSWFKIHLTSLTNYCLPKKKKCHIEMEPWPNSSYHIDCPNFKVLSLIMNNDY